MAGVPRVRFPWSLWGSRIFMGTTRSNAAEPAREDESGSRCRGTAGTFSNGLQLGPWRLPRQLPRGRGCRAILSLRSGMRANRNSLAPHGPVQSCLHRAAATATERYRNGQEVEINSVLKGERGTDRLCPVSGGPASAEVPFIAASGDGAGGRWPIQARHPPPHLVFAPLTSLHRHRPGFRMRAAKSLRRWKRRLAAIRRLVSIDQTGERMLRSQIGTHAINSPRFPRASRRQRGLPAQIKREERKRCSSAPRAARF